MKQIDIILKTLLLTLGMLLMAPSTLSAVPPADSCPGDVIPNNVSEITGNLTPGALGIGTNKDDYYRYMPGAGFLTIRYSSNEPHKNAPKKTSLKVGKSCDSNDILDVNNRHGGQVTSYPIGLTDIIYLHVAYENDNADYKITLSFTPESSRINNTADDLCYENPASGGLLCINNLLGIVDVRLLCKDSINIRNQGGASLSDVQAVYYNSADLLNVNALSDCGVDNVSGSGGLLGGALNGLLNNTLNGLVGRLLSGIGNTIAGLTGINLNTLLGILTFTNQTCGVDTLVDVGPLAGVGLLSGSREWFNLPDYEVNATHSIYQVPLLNAALFSGNYSSLYGSYIKNGVRHSGLIPPCSATTMPTVVLNGDFIDTPITTSALSTTYNDSTDTSSSGIKYITTKIQAKTTSLTAVYLNDFGSNTDYDNNSNGDVDKKLWFAIPLLNNLDTSGTCPSVNSSSLQQIIDPTTGNQIIYTIKDLGMSDYSQTKDVVLPSNALKNAKIEMLVVDTSKLSTDAQNCVAVSSTTGNPEGLGQCVNYESQYVGAYGKTAYDRCADDATNGQPCLPENHGKGTGLFNGPLGCLICTFYAGTTCSSDNFAIRPNDFNLSIPSSEFPDLLRAGQNYNTSLTARNFDGATSGTYTIADHNWAADLGANTTKYFKNNTIDTAGLLHGTAEVNTSVTAYSLGGLSSDSNTSVPSLAEAVIPMSYDDVGKINLQLYDRVWAAVDNDDTSMDCNDSHAHTYICSDKNVTFIPHHFNVENTRLRNHGDSTLTYLSNDLNMSAHIDANISARNANNGITQNFRQGSLYYENPVSIDLNVTDWNATLVSSLAPYVSRHILNNAKNIHDIPTAQLLGFGLPDANGTHTIPWNESNASQQLMFNYARENNATVNPFVVPGSDVNITVSSRYTGTAPEGNAEINGTALADANATFVFGRAKPSSDFYEDITNGSVNTPISIVVYCGLLQAQCATLGIDTLNGQTNESDWWLSTGHNETRGDGNIKLLSPPTVTEGAGAPTVTTDVTVITNGQDNDINVTSNATALPMAVQILLNTTTPTDTNTWLIYNENNDILNPNPFYKVRFIGQSGWAGHGDTGHVVDSNVSAKHNKRLGW
jgi:hypothetical protein